MLGSPGDRSWKFQLDFGADINCQSLFTIPYDEKFETKPKSILGLMDPLVRNFIPEEMVSFSVPSNRLVEMVINIQGSFFDKDYNNPKSF